MPVLKKVVLPASDGRGISFFSVVDASVAFSTDGAPLSEAATLLADATGCSVTFAGAA